MTERIPFDEVVPTERTYVLTLRSMQGNSHVRSVLPSVDARGYRVSTLETHEAPQLDGASCPV